VFRPLIFVFLLLCVCLTYVFQITASHLALASQSVGLLVTQIPVLRSVLAGRLPAKHHVLLHALDRVARDCQEHQREIFAKLVAIMDQLVRDMRDKAMALPWAHSAAATAGAAGAPAAPLAPPSLSAEEVSKVDDCVRTLMKQTCSLHRALSDLLLVEQRDLIFRSISHAFLSHLTDMAHALDTNQHVVKLKLSANINHIVTRSAGQTEQSWDETPRTVTGLQSRCSLFFLVFPLSLLVCVCVPSLRLRSCTGADESAIQQLTSFVL